MFKLFKIQYIFILLFFCTSAFLFSGIFRAIVEIDLGYSTLLSFSLHIIFLVRLVRDDLAFNSILNILPNRKELIIFILLTLIPLTIFFILNKFSIIELGVADAYHHFKVVNRFEYRYPNAYHGFVSFYSFVLLVKRLFATNIYLAFFISIYYFLFYTITTFYLIYFKLGKLKYNLLNNFTFLLLTLCFLLPIYFEFIGQGGYIHALSISIIPTFILLYSVISRPLFRIILLILIPLIVRYTYGLNLGDFILAVSILIALELKNVSFLKSNKLKYLAVLFGALVSLRGYSEIIKIIKKGGASSEINSLLIFAFILMLSYMFIRVKDKIGLTKEQNRLFIMSLIIGIISVIAQLGFLLVEFEFTYYDYKYITHIFVVIAFISPILIFKISDSTVKKVSYSIALLVLSFLSINSYINNTYFKDSDYLIDFNEIYAIQDVLSETKNKFGGFICHSWPRFRIINHHFGKYKQTSYKYYMHSGRASFKLKDNSCIFWQNNKKDREKLAKVMGGKGAFFAMHKFKKIAKEQKVRKKHKRVDSDNLRKSNLSYVCS